MKVEIILLLVIGLVFLIDFLMKGIKKKPSSTEVDVKKTDDQSFNNTDNKPKKKINLLKLFVVFIFGIPISLIGSYLAALYYKTDTQFLQNFRLDSDFIIIIQTYNFINCLIWFSIYLVFIAVFWKKNKIIWNNVGVLKYISERKKNISLALIIIPFLKVILHYVFYPIRTSHVIGSRTIAPNKKSFSQETYEESFYSEPYRESFGEHLDSIFEYELFLFIPSIIIVLFIAWYFNDKIKAR
jgi:hypothetical protein